MLSVIVVFSFVWLVLRGLRALENEIGEIAPKATPRIRVRARGYFVSVGLSNITLGETRQGGYWLFISYLDVFPVIHSQSDRNTVEWLLEWPLLNRVYGMVTVKLYAELNKGGFGRIYLFTRNGIRSLKLWDHNPAPKGQYMGPDDDTDFDFP